MRLLACILLCLASIIKAQVTSPSSGTVWVNGNTATITWGSISGSEFSIVLTRTGTVYHHTITSTAANTGSFSWQVEIPSQDGWPGSTSSDMVYEIDFYINGGWNNGGTLVASSQEFAIVYTAPGGSSPVIVTSVDPAPDVVTTDINPAPVNPTTITFITSPQQEAGIVTTVQTEVIIVVGVTTFTTATTAVYQVGTANPTNTVIVTTTVPPPTITITITNTQQLNPTIITTGPSTTFVTTFIGATTVGTTGTVVTNQTPAGLYSSATANVAETMWLSVLAILTCGVIVFI